MFFKFKKGIFVFLVLAGLLLGCQSLDDHLKTGEDGKKYGFSSGLPYKWWHYYEGASSFAEGGFWDEAETCLKKAIQQRGKDHWRARTYGWHFIDYFPNRELGIAHYYLSDLKNARKQLEISLSQTPSAKTIFYLNKVYEELIENNVEIDGKVIEMSFPEIRIDSFRTKDEPVVIAGDVKDETYIKSIYVNDAPVYWLNSLEDFERNLDEKQLARVKKQEILKELKTKVSFKKQLLFLPQGEQFVTIKAENIKGGVRTKEIEVRVDRIGPMISVSDIKTLKSSDKGKKTVRVSGFLNDESGVSALSVKGVSKLAINEKVVSIEESKTVSFDETVEIDKDNELEIVAHDGLGNETSTRIAVADSGVIGGSALFASAGVADGRNWVAVNGNEHPTMKVEIAGITVSDGREITVYQKEVPFQVTLNNGRDVKKMRINGDKKILISGDPVVSTGTLELSGGRNEINFEAIDGNDGIIGQRRKIVINKVINKPLEDQRERLRFFVFPFKYRASDNKVPKESLSFRTLLNTSLHNDSHKYNRFQLETEIPQEFLTDRVIDCSNEEDANKKLAIKYVSKDHANKGLESGCFILIGEFVEKRSRECHFKTEIKGYLVDISNEIKLIPPIDVYDCNGEKSLEDLARELAAKIHVEFPLIVGMIIKREKNRITTDLSEYKKLKENYKLILYEGNSIGGRAKLTLPPVAKILRETSQLWANEGKQVITE